MNPSCYGNCWETCKCASCDCQWQCEKETNKKEKADGIQAKDIR